MIDRAELATVPTFAEASREALTALSRHAYSVSFRHGQRVISLYRPVRRLIFIGKAWPPSKG